MRVPATIKLAALKVGKNEKKIQAEGDAAK